MKKRNIIMNIGMILLVLYATFTFFNQQKTLNAYKSEQQFLTAQIKEKVNLNQELLAKKDNINSPEYIEAIAREKSDMYKENERVYIDIGK